MKLRNETSGSNNLNNLIIHWESITPNEFKHVGEGLLIHYGHYNSPFGHCFLATTPRGICKLAFFDSSIEASFIQNELYKDWQNATIERNDGKIATLATLIFTRKNEKQEPLTLFLKGSRFQLKVWEALLSIPVTHLATYEQMAVAIKNPKATRAVASAIAKNNIAYLIPCHRVIRKNGDFGEYRWKRHRKQALIAWEAEQQLRLPKVLNQTAFNAGSKEADLKSNLIQMK